MPATSSAMSWPRGTPPGRTSTSRCDSAATRSIRRATSPEPVPTPQPWGRGRRGLLVRLGRDPQVGLDGLPALRELGLGVLVGDGRDDDHVLALLPVARRRDAVLRGPLQGIDDPEDLVEVPARARRVRDDELDLLVRPDDEYRAHGHALRRGGVDHVVELTD